MTEVPIDFSGAAVTASGCSHPERAFDGDAQTVATFGPPDAAVDTWQPVTSSNPQPGQCHAAYFSVTPTPLAPRFLRAEWGTAEQRALTGGDDRFITQIRVKASGAGVENAGVSLLSSLGFIEHGEVGDPPEIPLLLPPFPDGEGFYTLAFDPPFLSSGVVFHPDALFSAAELAHLAPGDYPTLLLTQLDVFESVEESNPIMANPTTRRARAGVQEVKIYPHNDGAGPYDNTTECVLAGLSELGISTSIKVANVEGGETVHLIDGFETGRTTKVKVTAAKSDLRALFIILGGTNATDAPSGGLGEVQYFAENFTDRAPFFRLKAKSTVGNGADSFVFFKCKVDGSVNYNLSKDKVTDLDFEATLYYDDTAVRQDGTTGGVREWLYGSKGETTRHS